VIFSLVTLILQEYLGGWRLRWALWALACGGFILLANVLFVVGELRAFLAYMAVFHAAFILVGSHRVESSLTYALLYALMNVHFVGAMLALRRPRPQFLADLQGVSALSGVGGSLVCAIAAMSGIPPLAGFWAKAAVVAALAARGDYVLASLALACGLVLMYYYMQNYRFSAAARRGAVLVWSGSAAAAAAGLVGNLMLPALLNDV
jgi:NADH-quinone oxidoreductase subunit N